MLNRETAQERLAQIQGLPEDLQKELRKYYPDKENATVDAAAESKTGDNSTNPIIPQGDEKVKVRATKNGYAPVDTTMPPKIELMSAQDLQNADLPPIRFIVDEILTQGLGLLTSPSKYGKSWFAMDLGLSVAEGAPFLGFKTEKCGVFYLALEDGYRRLKKRMNDILKGSKAPDGFDYAIVAPVLNEGFEAYLRQYINGHLNVGLIIIDVLQKIRPMRNNSNAYAADYADMSVLKRIADDFGIAILVLHHNRKMKDDDDPFNAISGTMALMGTADTIWVMNRQKRVDEETTLNITGRDIEMNSYKITWDKNTCRQKLIGNVEEIETMSEHEEYYSDPAVITIKALLEESPNGVVKTASDYLMDIAKYTGSFDIDSPVKLGKHFDKIKPKLYHYDRIVHKKDNRRNHGFSYQREREFTFKPYLVDESDNADNPFL